MDEIVTLSDRHGRGPMTLVRIGPWCVALAMVALGVLSALLGMRYATAGEPGNVVDVLWPTPFVAMTFVGALLGSRRPRNTVGWALLGGGSMMVLQLTAQVYATVSISGPARLPAADLAAWSSQWTWMCATALISLVFITFPTGSPPSPRWRPVAGLTLALAVAPPFVALPVLGAPAELILEVENVGELPGGTLIGFLSQTLLFIAPVGFAALAVRFFRSRGIEQLQMKWFVLGASLLPIAILVAVLIGGEDPIDHPVVGGATLLAMTAIPVTAAIAILRYRLYDIDRIVSRTVSYAIVTAVLGGMFALVVLLPPVLLGGDRAPDYMIAVATLVVAALFRPLRRRVQDAVDHRFNRKRYDAEHTIEAFTARLREQIDIDALGDELRSVVMQSMQPTHISMWLREDA